MWSYLPFLCLTVSSNVSPVAAGLASVAFRPFLQALRGGEEQPPSLPCLCLVWQESCAPAVPSPWKAGLCEGPLELNGAWTHPLWLAGRKHVVFLPPWLMIERGAMLLLVIYASYRIFSHRGVFRPEHHLDEFPAPLGPCVPVCSLPGSRCLPEGAGP